MSAFLMVLLRCGVVMMLCFVQLVCVNSGIPWLTFVHIGLVALVIATLTPTPFFWYVLIGYPTVLSWYSGTAIFLDSWIYALIAAVLWLLHTFLLKERHFLVRFGFVCIATVLWYVLHALAFVVLRYFGYTSFELVTVWSLISEIAIAIALHTLLLLGWSAVARYSTLRNAYVS